MKTTALGFVLTTSVAAMLTVTSFAQTTATTPPVGYYTLTINGASDNVMSLPMVRDAVFTGTVNGSITANSFTVLAGTASPGWTASQFVYSSPAQPLTYYVEFTTGQLKGLYYKITGNGTGSLTLDTEGDDLTNHPVLGVAAALASGDGITIRPFWRIKDVFEVGGAPIIEAWPDPDDARDEVLIPNYASIGQNKAADTLIHYDTTSGGWRVFGDEITDYADYILRPNEAFIIRRRNSGALNLTNLGSVNMNRAISFVPGGNASSGNDTYVSIARPASVSLAASGLWNANPSLSLIQESVDPDNPSDVLLAFSPGTGFNRAADKKYYYLAGSPANQGWRLFPDDATDVSATAFLDPGQVYIVRKVAGNPGRDWVNDPNY